jgi:hypothetical protein
MTRTATINPRVDQSAADPFFSEADMNRLRQAIADVEAGTTKLTEHELIEVSAIAKIREAFAADAEKLGLNAEDEILQYCVDLCKEVRREKREAVYANNA